MSNNDSMTGRVLALAGLLQALTQVRQLAETGTADDARVRPIADSIFRIDSASVTAVYGNRHAVARGLSLLKSYLQDEDKDETLSKMAVTVFQLERRFMDEPSTIDAVQNGIRTLQREAHNGEDNDPDTLRKLGDLYSTTISKLKPNVMVQGNPQYLNRPDVVAEIRAMLLGALRAAVLWRQMGGTLWDFLIRRRAMLAAIEAL